MQAINIRIELEEADAAEFVGRDVIVVIPATEGEYQGFIVHGTRIETGLAMCAEGMAAMLDPEHPGDKAEGLQRLAGIVEHMRESERAMQAFFSRHAATHVAVAGTGRVN